VTTADQLTPAQKQASGPFAGYFASHGWGLGMSVVTELDGLGEPVGRFGWNGGLGLHVVRRQSRLQGQSGIRPGQPLVL
jgi:hypothetical protein